MNLDQRERLAAMLDREELFDLVRRERFARDQRLFDVMRDCFHDDAYVRTTWYDGRGGAAYVEATKTWMARAGNGKHWVFPAYAQVNGDRATVESPAKIFSRTMVDGVEVDFHAYCRFFSRAVRVDGSWKLMTFEVLMERDELRPVHAGSALPVDAAQLEGLRPSYRFLTWIQSTRGVTVSQDLLGDDRPAELDSFHQGEMAWLAGRA
ncbi:MAG TPA: nuclear transport factor 2 family protein [Actinomycetales bacterium]|nr:nuclear transport factor 2 family protein [Actinomycetales bacterium]